MEIHKVRTRKSAEEFPREQHLAYKIARVDVDPVKVPEDSREMICNRIIDNAAVESAFIVTTSC